MKDRQNVVENIRTAFHGTITHDAKKKPVASTAQSGSSWNVPKTAAEPSMTPSTFSISSTRQRLLPLSFLP